MQRRVRTIPERHPIRRKPAACQPQQHHPLEASATHPQWLLRQTSLAARQKQVQAELRCKQSATNGSTAATPLKLVFEDIWMLTSPTTFCSSAFPRRLRLRRLLEAFFLNRPLAASAFSDGRPCPDSPSPLSVVPGAYQGFPSLRWSWPQGSVASESSP